ncbi:MAG: phosphoglycerate dehydrogenase [Armatimonadota bacterium]|nr:phosphoglycerate dehydrogenase [Armatimonadota bacterium]MDR7550586.1 phosphoglycerate dehydrogenase [Armatimonadota bacterium]
MQTPSTPPRVLISAPDFGRAGDAAFRLLEDAGCEIIANPRNATLTEEELLALVADADAIIAGTEPMTARVLAAAPRLKIIARRGVGLDSVDVEAATARGVIVTATAGALTDAVADHTLGLILAVARKIPSFDRMVKAGRWERALGVDVGGKTLGIVGFGAIGRAVARRAAGFGMGLLACDVAPDPSAAAALGVTFCDLPTLLASSDIVTLHVPLTPTTRHLIDDAALGRMKPTAILINASRGDVVDEAALTRALREGRLAGAGLDVFHDEPVRDVTLVGLENVVATPHVASFTRETVARMERACAEAVLAVLRGERPSHAVNPEVYERRSPAP